MGCVVRWERVQGRRFNKWRNRPGCDVHSHSRCLNVLGASCAVRASYFLPPRWGCVFWRTFTQGCAVA